MARAPIDDNFEKALLAENDVSLIAEPVKKDNTTGGLYIHIVGTDIPGLGTSATATVTSVDDTASSTTLLSANTSRRGAAIFNNSSSDLYVKLGTTASATDFTIKLAQDDYYETPAGYTGRIDGIWSSNSTGAALITELT